LEAVIESGSSTPEQPRAKGGARKDDALADWISAWQPEDAPLLAARQRAAEVGIGAVEPAAGAVLRMLCAAAGARTVVEVGTGAGVSSLWLLRGMRPDGVLTVLDTDPEQLRAARRALADAGVPPGRTRMIFGTPAEVLPRLSPGAYDVVVCAGPPAEYAAHLDAVVGLVRAGGTLACHGLLAGDRIGDRAARDPQTVAWRELARAIREDEALTSAVLPIGAGLLVATRRA